jgi:hypothetical protein
MSLIETASEEMQLTDNYGNSTINSECLAARAGHDRDTAPQHIAYFY